MTKSKKMVRCNRCGTSHVKEKVKIINKKLSFYYCPRCISLNRVTSYNQLYFMTQKSTLKQHNQNHKMEWSGKLTSSQAKISGNLLTAYNQRQKKHLISAVTGAGKTEILFALIERVLSEGKTIGVASPRVDVCLELYPRFKSAFPKTDIVLLYGQQPIYNKSSFFVCTTHQLLRFYKMFDVLIVDEVDSFPYADSEFLKYGTKKSLKRRGLLIYLTATPTKRLMAEFSSDKQVSFLSKRFHGFPLPVPQIIWCRAIMKKIGCGKLPSKLCKLLNNQDKHLLIFLPSIKKMKQFYKLIAVQFPDKRIAMVHAASNKREAIVLSMRNNQIDWLLTTTILERGVTFPGIDVLVVQANHSVFTMSTLVQISGRVGRSPDYPTGNIYFVHDGISLDMKRAKKFIESMNGDESI
ncbi:DEAD/DEAH box helicase [Vagococcus vulneris]|uniref:DNA/RNA helicase n=1 Tax=Vagococcus vulneris TaxID=1977869 RepID=A0A430A1G9_9ENTE|nr:helicase-related protein [Vagococcus vulneris]RSU00179.1 hypothetical protein CBF37_02460 [Vagococcus vulneris]